MARINFDDNVESQPEFWRLLPLVDGNRLIALGMLVVFFRIAQKHYGRGEAIAAEIMIGEGLEPLIKSGWAVPADPSGATAVYQAKGAGKHFSWYRQKCEAGKRGGRPKTETEPRLAEHDPVNPLALALAPALSKKKNTHESAFRKNYSEEFEELWKSYGRIGSKSEASTSLGRLSLNSEEAAALRRAIPVYLADCRANDRFIQHMATFLNSDWRQWLEKAKPRQLRTLDEIEEIGA